jgi:hypothetical protein
MRSITVRLPDQLVIEIEAESLKRSCAKSDIVRERLQRGGNTGDLSARLHLIGDLIGSVESLPAGLSGQKKKYLKTLGYGRKPTR